MVSYELVRLLVVWVMGWTGREFFAGNHWFPMQPSYTFFYMVYINEEHTHYIPDCGHHSFACCEDVFWVFTESVIQSDYR